jgi:hypothetical protein
MESTPDIPSKKEITMSQKNIFIMFGSIMIFLFGMNIYQGVVYHKNLATQIVNLTAVKDGFILNDLPIQEQREKYRKFMIRIFDVYGYQYEKEFTKALRADQQADYIDMTFDLDNLLGFEHYTVPTAHLMESAFNPRCHNTTSGLDEKGIGQQVWTTAVWAEALLNRMPGNYQKALHFEIKTSDDLYDWETATKITYVLMWWNRRDFHTEEWWVSIYHWGGFLSRYWDDGEGSIPTKFTINGIVYRVIDYYVAWKKLQECFSRGQLEPSIQVVEKWQNYQKKLMAEEVQLRTARGIIRKLRAELEEKKFMEDRLQQQYSKIDVVVSESLESLNKVYGDASKKPNGEEIRKKLNEAKGIVKKTIADLSNWR